MFKSSCKFILGPGVIPAIASAFNSTEKSSLGVSFEYPALVFNKSKTSSFFICLLLPDCI